MKRDTKTLKMILIATIITGVIISIDLVFNIINMYLTLKGNI